MKILLFITTLILLSCSSSPRQSTNFSFNYITMNEEHTKSIEEDTKENILNEITVSYDDYKNKTNYPFHDDIAINKITVIAKSISHYKIKNSKMEFFVAKTFLNIDTYYFTVNGTRHSTGVNQIPLTIFKIKNYDKKNAHKLKLRMEKYRVRLKELSNFSKEKWFILELDNSFGTSEFYSQLQNKVFFDWHKRSIFLKI